MSSIEILKYEPGHMVKASSTSGSFPITFTRIVQPIEEGGRYELLLKGTVAVFKLAEPLLRRLVQRSVNADYQNLKRIMEQDQVR